MSTITVGTRTRRSVSGSPSKTLKKVPSVRNRKASSPSPSIVTTRSSSRQLRSRKYSNSRSPVRQRPSPDVKFVDPGLELSARSSLLDPHSLFEERASMRGFVTIFWVFIFYQFSMLMFRNWQDGGNIMPWTIAHVFFGDIRGFVLIEAVLIAVTYLGFVIQLIACWAEKRRIQWLSPASPIYWLLRITLELSLTFMPMFVTIERGWHAIQRGSYLLHSLAMSMKVHSYLSINTFLTNRSNVTFADYTNFLLAPTLIYSPNFPRTEKIRPFFIVEKVFGMLVSGVMLYLTVENYVYPIISHELETSHPMTLLEVIIRLFPALLATTLLMFILTFECILNILAELSRFADRHFYADWWNR